MVLKKEIIYPIFFECCKYTLDVFWKKVFEDLAYGITPYGTYINKNFLCCSYKTKEFSYKIESNDIELLYKDVFVLLHDKFGLLSPIDKLKKRDEFFINETKLKENQQYWVNIRKKKTKDLLLELFIVEMKNLHHLSLYDAKYIFSFINVALMLKVIIFSDIEYSDNKIKHINGIEFKNNTYVIDKNLYANLDIDKTLSSYLEPKSMFDNWDKYLVLLRKHKKIL